MLHPNIASQPAAEHALSTAELPPTLASEAPESGDPQYPFGTGGSICSPYSVEPLKILGLDPQEATKPAVKLHAHSVQCGLPSPFP